ncbi:hypothetical protein BDB01DRAFT_126676 [Pilobolus umbonatus]|nr:hypothetical protein BDB01DRAFT_126676 [Pilobolus umbonatus]
MKGHVSTIDYFFNLPGEKIDVNFKDQKGYTMLHSTVMESMNNKTEMEANMVMIKRLLSKNADVNSQNLEGYTALHTLATIETFKRYRPAEWFSFYKSPQLLGSKEKKKLASDDMDGIEYLLSIGGLFLKSCVNINIKNNKGETPFATAMFHGNHSLVLLFMQSGANFCVDRDRDNNGFFHYFGKLLAQVDSIQPHNNLYALMKSRYVEVIESIWQVVKNKWNFSEEEFACLNEKNDQGFPPIPYAVNEALQNQKKATIREMKMISNKLSRLIAGKEVEVNGEPSEPLPVRLTFDFTLWLKYMKLCIHKFEPDLNMPVDLPKNFKKVVVNSKITNYPQNTGYTALHFAAKGYNTELIQFLLENGSQPNARVAREGIIGNTPMIDGYYKRVDSNAEMPDDRVETIDACRLYFCITKPNFKEMLENNIKVLLHYGASPYLSDDSKINPIILASAQLDGKNLCEMCKVEPEEDVDVNVHDYTHRTALMYAVDALKNAKKKLLEAENGINLDSIQYLLEANADLNITYSNYETIFMHIIQLNYLPLLEVALMYVRCPIVHSKLNNNKDTALMIACKLKEEKIASLYLDYLISENSLDINLLNKNGCSALLYACRNNHKDNVEKLLKMNANPNVHCNTHIPLIAAINTKNIELVKSLVQSGADVNSQLTDGTSALHAAVMSEKHAIVRFLLESNCDVSVKNNKRQTALHLSIESTKAQTNRSFRIEQLLLKAHADINAVDFLGRTPLHYVFVSLDLIPLTKDSKILKEKVNQIAADIESRKKRKSALNQYSNNLRLHDKDNLDKWIKEAKKLQIKKDFEDERAKLESVEISEDQKALISKYTKYTWESETSRIERFDPVDIIKYLCSSDKIKCDVTDQFGRTPLHYAAAVGAYSCATSLLHLNANYEILDTDNNGALQLALQNNFVEFSVMLANAGASPKENITLRTGEVMSTFGYSLLSSVINLAYLVIDRGVSLLDAVQDTLKYGKFNMAEVLLKSAKGNSLFDALENGKNVWHIICDFEPFSEEIWLEYVEFIVQMLESIGIPMCLDQWKMNPLHYAAKNGQLWMCKYLLSLNNPLFNNFDINGKSELDYAVESGNHEIVELLIETKFKMSSTGNINENSTLLKAVCQANVKIIKSLLKYGACLDLDSDYGRSNSVMKACLLNNSEILQLLIDAHADLDKPSSIQRTLDGKSVNILVHPIFVAMKTGEDIIKTLVRGGANVNVFGPMCEPELGRTPITFATTLQKMNIVELLVDHNVDVDIVDGEESRSIFYQFFFANMKYGSSISNSHPIDSYIYDLMLEKSSPNLNLVDVSSGMTPLELAIRENNILTVKRLLKMGADPNIESCSLQHKVSQVNISNPEHIPIHSLAHVIIQNNLELMQLIVNESKIDINWEWEDIQGHNLLTYIIGGTCGYSHQNKDLLTYAAKKMQKSFKKLICKQDRSGKSPLIYAYRMYGRSLYETIIKLEPSLENEMKDDPPSTDLIADDDMSVDIECLTSLEIEEAANKERQLLQEAIDKKKDKANIKEKDNLCKVDTYSGLADVGYVCLDEFNDPFDALLMKVETSHGTYVSCKFYKMSVIHNKVLDVYVLWTRWGYFGCEGAHQRTPYPKKEDAVAEFKTIFKSKTGNVWNTRKTSFVIKPKRYQFQVERSHPKDNVIENFDFIETSISSNLPRGTADIMKLICNYQYISRVYKDTNIALPLGQIPQATLERGVALLKECVTLSRTMNTTISMSKSNSQLLKDCQFQLVQKFIEYSYLLPHETNVNEILALSNTQVFKKQYNRVQDLLYINYTSNVLLAAKHNIASQSPLDYAYKALNCLLNEITKVNNPYEYELINSYMNADGSDKCELVRAFSVNRAEEAERFKPFEYSENRMLLWHGSKMGNIMGILKQGLRIAPISSSHNGSLFGQGIYFADVMSKSLNYCEYDYQNIPSPFRVMFLCEVALGKSVEESSWQITENQRDSTKALGMNIPDSTGLLYDTKGVAVPLGNIVKRENSAQLNAYWSQEHNEFIVHDESRVKIRYLVVLRKAHCCTLGTNCNGSLSPLNKFKVENFKYSAFNNYEAEIVKAYLVHKNKTPQDIFDEDLDSFIEDGLLRKHYKSPLDLESTIKVCLSCAMDVAVCIMERRIITESKSSTIPEISNKVPFIGFRTILVK